MLLCPGDDNPVGEGQLPRRSSPHAQLEVAAAIQFAGAITRDRSDARAGARCDMVECSPHSVPRIRPVTIVYAKACPQYCSRVGTKRIGCDKHSGSQNPRRGSIQASAIRVRPISGSALIKPDFRDDSHEGLRPQSRPHRSWAGARRCVATSLL